MSEVASLSRVFELAAAEVVETSPRAFALLEEGERIVLCNRKMLRLLEVSDAQGVDIKSYFPNSEEKISHLCRQTGPRTLERMEFVAPGNKQLRVATAEFGRIGILNKEYSVAVIADVTTLLANPFAVFDYAEFGMVRMNDAEVPLVQYINYKGAELLGRTRSDIQGKHVPLEEIFPNEENVKIVKAQRLKRALGQATHYTLALPANNGEHEVPIEVFALPDFDLSGENYIGTTAIFQPTLEVTVLRKIHACIEANSEDPNRLCRKVISEIGRVIPHDFAVVSIYHDEWARAVHLEPRPDPDWDSSWFKLRPSVLEFLAAQPDKTGIDGKPIGGVIADDISKLIQSMSDAEELSADAVTRRLAENGFAKVLCLPLREQKKWRASLNLFRVSDATSFNQHDISVLRDSIGGISFLQAVVQSLDRKADSLKTDLIHRIQSSGSLEKASKILCDTIAEAYGWQHVSYFKCNYATQKFELNHESGHGNRKFKLGSGFEQDFEVGILGYAFKNKETIILNDLEDGSVEAGCFVKNDPHTLSSLTVPIMLGGLLRGNRGASRRPAGMLHIQSMTKKAFPPPVVGDIRKLVETIEMTLQSLQREGLITALQEEIPSGLVLSDSNGTIWGINDTALRMLGLPADTDRRPRMLRDIFADESSVRIVLQPLNIRKERVTLNHVSQSDVSALVDTTDLTLRSDENASRTGLRLVQLIDLTTLRWRHDIETIRAAISNVAREVQPHLINAHGFISKIRSSLSDEFDRAEPELNKLKEEIKNIKFTTDDVIRLMSSERTETKLVEITKTDLIKVLRGSIERISRRLRERISIRLDFEDQQIFVDASEKELDYIFDTLLEYICSRKALNEKLRVKVGLRDGWVNIRLAAKLGEVNLNATDSMTRAYRIGLQLTSLNQDQLAKTLQNYGGSLLHNVTKRNVSEFKLVLPRSVDGKED